MTEPIKHCPQPDPPELVMRADGYHYLLETEMSGITLNAHQLHTALELVNPDEGDLDQLQSEVTIEYLINGVPDFYGPGDGGAPGLYLWLTEYPEEGSIWLDPAPPVNAAVTAPQAREALDLAERLKQEAQIHAQEARTANATIAEIYQLCTGATGEPGTWHGAEPVRAALAAQQEEVARLREALFGKNGALERMDVAREWLTDGNPRTECNWGVLDTSNLRAALNTQGAKA